jgi:hypothetical protein
VERVDRLIAHISLINPISRRGSATLLSVMLVIAGSGPSLGQAGGMCDSPPSRGGGAVSIVVLASSSKVHEFAATVRGTPVLRRDKETVVFADGRVVTSDVEAAGRHLNALGWGSRNVQIVASLSRGSGRASPG